jgi:uncharacterized protein YecE (DUF72 family)
MDLQLYIGETHLRGAISRYASCFNLLELRVGTGRLPRAGVLRRWREEVPDKFVFSLLLSREIGRFTGDNEEKLNESILAAQVLKAKWMVIQTDPSVGPSQRSRQRLTTLFLRLSDTGRNVAWEPHGVWQDDEAAAFAQEFGVHCVRDIGRGKPTNEKVIYSRMPGLGTSARLSAGALEKAARCLVGASEAYVVVGGEGARRLQQLLPGLIGNVPEQGMSGGGAFDSVEVFGGFASLGVPVGADIENEPSDGGFDADDVDLDEEPLDEIEPRLGESDDDSDESETDDPPEGESSWNDERSGSSKWPRDTTKKSRKKSGCR